MKPQTVTNIDMAFPAKVSHLMPNMSDIPREFDGGNTKWNKLFSDWFYCGLSKLELTPKDDISRDVALRHISTIMRSFEPKHEHKEAAVAYLLSLWFSDATWERAERKNCIGGRRP